MHLSLGAALRAAGTVIAALAGVVLLVLLTSTSTVASVLALTAATGTTVLIMGGTGHPLSSPSDTTSFVQAYTGMAVDNYVSPASTAAGIPAGPYNRVAVITPEQFAPDYGSLTFDQSVAEGQANLDNCLSARECAYNTDIGSSAPSARDSFVVFGYSQSATIATFEKRRLAAQFVNGAGPDVSFVFIGNGNRPNGGLLARGPRGFTIPMPLPIGGATFSGPTPTNTQYATVDIAGQYDVWSDVPLNPLNLLADANAYMGSAVHDNYGNVSLNDAGIVNQGQFGDTTYYLIPTEILPLLAPVEQLPFIGRPLADALDAPLRVLVEAGYDRTLSPGQPAPWNPLYMPNPVALATNFLVAIPTGLDNGLQEVIGIRPFGTQRPGPYGVGGPEVSYTNPPAAPKPATTAPTTTALRLNSVRTAALKGDSTYKPAALTATADDASIPGGKTTSTTTGNATSTAPVKTAQSTSNEKSPADPISAAADAIKHALSGGTDHTSTTARARKQPNTASTSPRQEAAPKTSSSASFRKAVRQAAQ